VPNLITAS